MYDIDYNRHFECPYFTQNSWMMSEGKYICELNPNEILFLQEIPKKCIKGFKCYHFPKGEKPICNFKTKKK